MIKICLTIFMIFSCGIVLNAQKLIIFDHNGAEDHAIYTVNIYSDKFSKSIDTLKSGDWFDLIFKRLQLKELMIEDSLFNLLYSFINDVDYYSKEYIGNKYGSFLILTRNEGQSALHYLETKTLSRMFFENIKGRLESIESSNKEVLISEMNYLLRYLKD